jgi:hypothetical protein
LCLPAYASTAERPATVLSPGSGVDGVGHLERRHFATPSKDGFLASLVTTWNGITSCPFSGVPPMIVIKDNFNVSEREKKKGIREQSFIKYYK